MKLDCFICWTTFNSDLQASDKVASFKEWPVVNFLLLIFFSFCWRMDSLKFLVFVYWYRENASVNLVNCLFSGAIGAVSLWSQPQGPTQEPGETQTILWTPKAGLFTWGAGNLYGIVTDSELETLDFTSYINHHQLPPCRQRWWILLVVISRALSEASPWVSFYWSSLIIIADRQSSFSLI